MDQTFNAVFTRGIGNQVQLYLIEALTHSHSIQLTIIVNNQSLISLNFWRGLRICQIFSGFNQKAERHLRSSICRLGAVLRCRQQCFEHIQVLSNLERTVPKTPIALLAWLVLRLFSKHLLPLQFLHPLVHLYIRDGWVLSSSHSVSGVKIKTVVAEVTHLNLLRKCKPTMSLNIHLHLLCFRLKLG